MGLLRRPRRTARAADDRAATADIAGTPGSPGTADAAGTAAVADEAVEELTALSADMERRLPDSTPLGRQVWYREHGRRRAAALVASVTRLIGRGGVAAARGTGYGSRALAERLLQAAPRIPVRDLATLRAHHPDAPGPEELADRLVAGACRASAAVGASIGAAAMLPVPPAMPAEIAAETLAVAAVEIKLIAELHQVYGLPATGTTSHRAAAYLTAWADRRGIDRSMLVHPASLAVVAVGAEVRQKVRKRLTRSTLRKLPSLAPLLIGAAVGALLNRRDTRKVAAQVRADLRGRSPVDFGYWQAAARRTGPSTVERRKDI